MFFLNLTLGQFLALFAAGSAYMVALYLLDRSRRKQTVATLRFWSESQDPPRQSHRRRIQQPWSLVLQLLSLALLLLALSQIRFGAGNSAPRDHVLVLDSSAWMAADTDGTTAMQRAREAARSYIRALPSSDRVMLVRADAVAAPATVFEVKRDLLERAIAETEPSHTALYLRRAIDFAERARRMQGRNAGELVLITANRIADNPGDLEEMPPNFRVIEVPGPTENTGIRHMAVRRVADDPDTWEIFTAVKNYGTKPRTVRLALQFGGAMAGNSNLKLEPGAEETSTFRLKTGANGILEARLIPGDALAADDAATLELPSQRKLEVLVYSDRPERLRPLLAASPFVEAKFRKSADQSAPGSPSVVIFDRCKGAPPAGAHAIWIDPPDQGSPFRSRSVQENYKLRQWNGGHPLGQGIRTRDLTLANARVFWKEAADEAIAESEAGPVILARAGATRQVVMGFHPTDSAMKYEVATPLLFANAMQWLAPDFFRNWETRAEHVGAISSRVGDRVNELQVVDEAGQKLPFTVKEGNVYFFSGHPGVVRVSSSDSEAVHSLTLPEVAAANWSAPADAARGIPGISGTGLGSRDWWQYFALAGALCLFAEWMLFGRRRLLQPETAPARMERVKVRRRFHFAGRKAS